MALNVPYQSQNLQPVVSLADSVGQWQTIKNQQQQEQRLTDQSAREAKTGDLQFQMTQHKALKEIATDFRSNLQRKAQEMGLKQGTPEYQQLANAMFTNNYNSTFQNITGKSHQPGTDIDLSAIDAVAGMTPQEELQQKIEGQKAEWDAHLPYQMQVAQAQAGLQQQSQDRQFQQQREIAALQNQYATQRDDTQYNRGQLEKIDEFERDIKKIQVASNLKQSETQAKPLPATIAKAQNDLIEQMGTAKNINNELEGIYNQIDTGKLNLSLTGNLTNKALNAVGMSTEESRAYGNMMAYMEKMRNDSLRLNNGVQTEGDAQRAWNEIFTNPNDTNFVKERLKKIQGFNEKAIELKKEQLNIMRSEYGKDEFNPQESIKTNQSTPSQQEMQQKKADGYRIQRHPKTGEIRFVKE